ncbi:MAG: DNA repair protein RecN [Gemmatimonadota bacterium]|nr:DNA repair protein RecN [Gemmatimonadota bacterium]MDH5759517.1 DNA repair protein RecN [Gemmatimonadota bacterium]
MLIELRIRDYAVVEDLGVTLGPGLNALTGETGAGKSIIVGALSLLLGERAASSAVRAGAERASVEAVFDVSRHPFLRARVRELGFEVPDGLLVLRREVAAEGRNRAWVNDSPTTAGVVGDLGSALVDLHGQHEHQTLLRAQEQGLILDAYCKAGDPARRVREAHQRVQEIRKELEEREGRRETMSEQADFLQFQAKEIEAARLQEREDTDLEAELHRLQHAEELLEGSTTLHETLYGDEGSVSEAIARAHAVLKKLVRFDPSLGSVGQLLDEALRSVEEAGRLAGEYAGGVEYDPDRLEHVRQRMDLIFRMKRKYGPELSDVFDTYSRVKQELAEMEHGGEDMIRLRKELEEAEVALSTAATELSALRVKGGAELAEKVAGILPVLGLPEAAFEVELNPLESIGPGGAESIAFLVAPNPGFEPMRLSRIASGGELARVMLALKAVLADVDAIPVLVFDEVDAGIGGAVANSVAEKLHDVSQRHQVLVVTHLAQVASKAAVHLVVEKVQEEGKTVTRVRHVAEADRVGEISRMLSGDASSEAARTHAEELLKGR